MWQGLARVCPGAHRTSTPLAKHAEQAALPSLVAADTRRHSPGRSGSRGHASPASGPITPNRRGPNLKPHSTLHFTMQSGAFDHAFQSATFRVREVREDGEQLTTFLQSLAQKLNSNQAFTPEDTFDVETTFIRTPGPRRGHGKR